MPYLRIHLYKTWFSFCLYQEDPRSNENKGTPEGLVTNYGAGGLHNGRGGGHVKFYHYKKGVQKKFLAVLKGRHKMFWGRFYVVA